MNDRTATTTERESDGAVFVGELWERIHEGDVVVSATEIAPQRFRVAAFFPGGQQWADRIAETSADAMQLGDWIVERGVGHVCTSRCEKWTLSDEAAGEWSDVPDAPCGAEP